MCCLIIITYLGSKNGNVTGFNLIYIYNLYSLAEIYSTDFIFTRLQMVCFFVIFFVSLFIAIFQNFIIKGSLLTLA